MRSGPRRKKGVPAPRMDPSPRGIMDHRRAAYLWTAAFLTISLFLLKDYGPVSDSAKNYREGQANFEYILTGSMNLQVLGDQTHGALSFMMADVFRRLLHGGLGWLDAVSARHAVLPLLLAPFLLCLFSFVKKRWDGAAAFLTVALLSTYPYVFGHAFNNLKDIPLLIFCSLSIACFVEWRSSRSIPCLYGHGMFLGLALSVKMYALLVPIIAWSWLACVGRPGGADRARPAGRLPLAHLTGSYGLAFGLVAMLYSPAFWGLSDKSDFLINRMYHLWSHVSSLSDATAAGINGRFGSRVVYSGGNREFWGIPPARWNIYSLEQIFYRTPVAMLLCAGAGLATSLVRLRAKPENALLIVWLALPLAIPCLPDIIHYDGMRNFLIFAVPFSILASLGLLRLAGLAAGRLRWPEKTWIGLLGSIVLGLNLTGLIATHPYETTFFNAFAGGLRGAQAAGIPFAGDYWFSSCRQAGLWLDQHAELGARIYVHTFSREALGLSLQRKDLSILEIRYNEQSDYAPGDYVVVVPNPYWKALGQYPGPASSIVHQIKRQGGEILTIYKT